RLVFMTGKFTIPTRGWEPLSQKDVSLPMYLEARGYRTALFCDCPHFFRPGMNYHRGFSEFRFIRGQESDKYVSCRHGIDPWAYLPARTREIPPERKHPAARRLGPAKFIDPLSQYLANVAGRGEDEADYFPGQTIRAAMKWLEDNADAGGAKGFLLWIELFDPHEPYDPPRKYYDLYRNPAYEGPRIIAPWFHSVMAEDFTEEEREDIRALYAGEVSLVDHWVGELLRKVDALGLRDETVIVFVSDHGTLLGERGGMAKQPIGSGMSQYVCGIPLIIRHPAGPASRRVGDLAWAPDLAPTCCEMLGEAPPRTVHGRSFWNRLCDGVPLGREYVVSGGPAMQSLYVVDADWRFLPSSDRNEEELYDRRRDPRELRNVAREHSDVCEQMRRRVEEQLALARSLNS
ncbi:MAG: sulfatase, partial [Candidatus Sumerlaeota bacterium]|nr:sulfatase [Candidatus Sumerlaeota bacterium]